MFWRWGKAFVSAILCCSVLTHCAEIDRRGGVVAEVEDFVLFTAHTKSHRLFRSYMLIGVLMAAARQAGHNGADKDAIEGNLKGALKVAFEAYDCLYRDTADADTKWLSLATSTISANNDGVGTFNAVSFPAPAICQFFDEKMARLDYALYRLALSALFNERSSAQLATIRDKLVGEVPVISASVKATIFAAKAVNQATTIVDDLLNLSFSSLGPALILLPLYRDSLEMNMWVIVDSLTKACPTAPAVDVSRFVNADGTPAMFDLNVCDKRDYAIYILSGGNGSLPLWRNFVRHMNYSNPFIEAYSPHFLLVSRFIWRSCNNLLSPDLCSAVIADAFKYAKGEAILVNVDFSERGGPVRTYSAQRQLPSRLATQPALPNPQVGSPPATSVPANREDQTGSVTRPVAPAR